MPKDEPWDRLTDPRFHRQNANLASDYTMLLMQLETIIGVVHEWAADLEEAHEGFDAGPYLAPLYNVTPVLGEYSRAVGALGSKQLVEMAVHQALQDAAYSGDAVSPRLTPRKPGDNRLAPVMVVKELKDDTAKAKRKWKSWQK